MSTANRKSSHWKKNNGRKTQQLIPIIVTWFIQLFITSRHNEYKSRSSLSEHKARTDGPRAGLVKNKRHWLESPDARHSICNDIDCGERFRKWVESSDYEWPATKPQGRKIKKHLFLKSLSVSKCDKRRAGGDGSFSKRLNLTCRIFFL